MKTFDTGLFEFFVVVVVVEKLELNMLEIKNFNHASGVRREKDYL